MIDVIPPGYLPFLAEPIHEEPYESVEPFIRPPLVHRVAVLSLCVAIIVGMSVFSLFSFFDLSGKFGLSPLVRAGSIYTATQRTTDSFEQGDSDHDGLSNLIEMQQGTNPLMSDTDKDAIDDRFEADNALDPINAHDATLDSDTDGLTNAQEYFYHTRPRFADSDHDGYNDGTEVKGGYNPLGAGTLF